MPSRYSVVVTAYNDEEWVGGAIESVLGQTHGDLELIVVDDGSSDGTTAAVREYASDSRLRLIEQENGGPSAARNTGIAATDSEWVAFLDSDDLWMPTYLEKVDAALAERPDAGFAYVDAWRLDVNGKFFRASAMARQNPPDDPPLDPHEFLRLLVTRGNFIFVSATVSRRALEAVGGFDPSLRWVEDLDLWIRILASGYGAVRTGERLAIKRDRTASLSGNERKMAVSLRDVYRLTSSYDVPPDIRAIADREADEIDRHIDALEHRNRVHEAGMRLRRSVGSLRRRALHDRTWHPETPPEIATAFPQLAKPAATES